jgi:hypothetical protein
MSVTVAGSGVSLCRGERADAAARKLMSAQYSLARAKAAMLRGKLRTTVPIYLTAQIIPRAGRTI